MHVYWRENICEKGMSLWQLRFCCCCCNWANNLWILCTYKFLLQRNLPRPCEALTLWWLYPTVLYVTNASLTLSLKVDNEMKICVIYAFRECEAYSETKCCFFCWEGLTVMVHVDNFLSFFRLLWNPYAVSSLGFRTTNCCSKNHKMCKALNAFISFFFTCFSILSFQNKHTYRMWTPQA